MQTIAAIAGVAMLLLWGKDKLAGYSLASFFSFFSPKKTAVTTTTVVESWEALHLLCETHGRKEALAKLDELFPLLIKVDVPVAPKAGA